MVRFTPRSSSSRVMLLLLAVTFVTSAALCVFAWRLAVVDRALREQLASQRLEQAADSGRSAILEKIAATGDRLRVVLDAEPAARPALMAQLGEDRHDRAALLLQQRTPHLFPAHALRYLPDTPAAGPLPDASFAAGEALEHQRHDYAAAARWFRQLADGSSDGVRAGALLRLARNEVKRKHPGRAIAAYEELAAMATTSVNGEPAALVARHARLSLLNDPARASEAGALLRDLESARWPISRTTYDYYRSELVALAPADAAPPIWEEAAAAIAAISQRAEIESGAQVIWVNGAHPVLLVWRAQHGDAAAIALTGRYLAEAWLAAEPGVAYGIETADRHVLIPVPSAERLTERVVSFAGQDWRLLAAATAAPVSGGVQSLWWIALSLLIVLILTGSYAVMRSVSRELAVARLQTDFVSAVSHEFRSPLTTLRSMSEMLERGRVPAERKQRYYELMARETSRLHRLVEDLLDFGRIEAGARVYDLNPTDLSVLVPQAIAEFEEEGAAAGFHIHIATLMPASVLADAGGLRRALRNLLENAVKYSGNARDIQVSVRTDARQVLISVQDSGIGIPQEDLTRIFRKFERGTEARASSVAGTGLGLALVSSIMQAHGGSVHVESALQRGSTFTLTLPCAPAADLSVSCRAS